MGALVCRCACLVVLPSSTLSARHCDRDRGSDHQQVLVNSVGHWRIPHHEPRWPFPCRSTAVGEASNPGPPLAISFANPTGIRSKELTCYNLPRGILNFAETHLALPGIKAVCRTLRRFADGDHRRLWLVPGEPVPLRARSLSTGVWSGVFQFSDVPAHRAHMHLPGGELALGRVQVSFFDLGSFYITGAVLYGWSPGPTSTRA